MLIHYSGGANGSDTIWDEIGRKFGVAEHIHYYHGTKTPLGNTPITEEELEEGWEKVLLANRVMCRYPEKYKSLLSRNWMQVKSSDAVFAIIKKH